MAKSTRAMPRTRRTLRLRFGEPGKEPDQAACTGDISPQGLFVKTWNLQDVGSTLWFEVELPDQVVQLHGQVVWRRRIPREFRSLTQSGFGVRLVSAPEEWFNFFFNPDTECAA